MKLENIVLILGGLAIIAAFFLPYINLSIAGQDVMEISGISIVESGVEMAQAAERPALLKHLGSYWNDAADFKGLGAVLGLLFVCLGPVLFLLYALGYLLKGARGKQYKRGIFFTILYTAASWAIIYFLGRDLGIEANFFSMAGLGFWIAFGGMWVAALSLFFSKNLE